MPDSRREVLSSLSVLTHLHLPLYSLPYIFSLVRPNKKLLGIKELQHTQYRVESLQLDVMVQKEPGYFKSLPQALRILSHLCLLAPDLQV